MPKYSLIIPIYNEEETIRELYRRVSAVMDSLDDSVELILINDGSGDRSLKLMRELQERDARVCYISFARNFGHQAAVTAGLNFARGQVIVVLDADLQDPPELIPKMIESWQAGYHVVYAQRTKRKKESWFKRLTAYVFYRLLGQLADVDIPADTGDFCLMDRQVVDLLNSMPERNRYIRGLRAWIGFHLGLFSALIALLMALLVLYWRLQQPDSPVTGLATILIAVFFLGSVQLISIGILGEYIGRIYEEVKGRPAYTIAEIAGLEIN